MVETKWLVASASDIWIIHTIGSELVTGDGAGAASIKSDSVDVLKRNVAGGRKWPAK